MSEVVRDNNGSLIEEGTRIAPYVDKDTGKELMPGGVVTSISDPDGDMDDYGQVVGINPYVTVLFDDGEDDNFTTHYQYHVNEYECDELEVA